MNEAKFGNEYEARDYMIAYIESVTGKLDILWPLCSSATIGKLYIRLYVLNKEIIKCINTEFIRNAKIQNGFAK